MQLLRTNRFLAVVGTSGSGKSSLVRAGMIAELHGGTMTQAGSTWEVMILRPGGSPIENLARAFVDADLYDGKDPSTLPRLLATLNRSRFGLVEAMKQCDLFEPGTNLLVVVDQFEELFRFRQQGVDSEEAAAAFVNLLLTASKQSESPIYATITMRSDYLGDCSEIPGLAEAVNEGEYLIPRLLRDQKRDAIEKPIGVGGAKISPLLVQRLLNDVGDDPDQLPVLQHTLMRMWDAWSAAGGDGRPIDFSDFEATGGLAAALSNHADEIFDALPDDRHRRACERVFKTLTEKGADNRGIRRPTRLAQLTAIAGDDRETVVTVLDAFRQGGVTLLMPGTEVELGDRTVLDLSHESLMRGWQRLRSWVEDEAQSARIFRRLADTASLWRTGKAGLFRDPDLQIALSWREQQQPSAEWAGQYGGQLETAIGFLDASHAEALAEEQAREAAQQRELVQAQQLAEAQQLRLDQQQRSARKLRMMIAGLAVVALFAGLACVAALVARNQAGRLARIADREAEHARANAQRAEQSQQATAQALTQVASQKAEVESSLTKAEMAEEAGRRLLYTTDMRLAPFFWSDDRTSAQKLRSLLAKHIPDSKGTASDLARPNQLKPDLRGFEWHFYEHLLESSAAVFAGHAVAVAGGAFGSNGRLVTLDQNGQIRRWNLSSHVEDEASRLNLPGGSRAQSRAISPDGRLAALAEATIVHVLDTSTGKENFQIEFGRGQGRGLIFTPDGGRLVLIDNKVRWCDAASGQVIASLDRGLGVAPPVEGQAPAASGMLYAWVFNLGKALSADGLTLAVVGHGLTGNQFSILRLDPTKHTVTPQVTDVETAGTLSAAGLSPDGRLLAVGAKLSGSVSVYDTGTGRQIAQHGSAHAAPVSAMTFSRDGFKLVTADVEGTIKIWEDARKMSSKSAAATTLKGHEAAITDVGFSSTGEQLLSTSADKTARVWDLDHTGTAVRVLERSGKGCYMARYSPDGLWIAAADGNSIRLWDAATGTLVRELSSGGRGRVYSVAFSPADNRLLAVGYGGQADVSYVALWDIDTGTELARLPGATDLPDFRIDENSGAVGALAFSPEGKYLVAGFGSPGLLAPAITPSPLKVWEVATRRLIRRLSGHRGYCVSLDFSRDGARLASGSRDGTAILWSTETWNAMHTLRNEESDSMYSTVLQQLGMVEDVAFAPDGKTLALASREGTVQFWEVATGKLLKTLKGHSSAVNAVVLSPDGRTLATGGSDQTVRLWNVESGRELLQLDLGNVDLGGVETLAFSPDGTQLLAGGKSTAFWSTESVVWNDPDRAAERLRPLLQSSAGFQSRVRMLSENLRLHRVLAKLDTKDVRVSAALAAAEANWHASRKAWPEAALAFTRLTAADPAMPKDWLRTPGLLRVATALLHQNRPGDAAGLLRDGARRRVQDGLPPAVLQVGFGVNDTATGELLYPLRAAIKERLAREPRSPGLLELRAELAGQWSDTQAQLADYTAAIVALSGQTPAPTADLQRLYARRGNAYVALRHWQQAVDDFARGVTTDDAVLTGQALALYQIHADPQAIEQLVERRPNLAGEIGDLFIQGQTKDWPRAVKIYSRGITNATTDARLLSKRAHGYEALENWDAAAADWSRAATGNPEAAKLLREFAQRLAEGGQAPLASGQFEKARALYERLLETDSENVTVATELAQVLLNQHEAGNPIGWTVLRPTELKSEGKATLTLKPDGSILASGNNPNRDIYTLVAKTELDKISVIRLEALPDPSLPHGGPGRALSGNFHLNELRVFSGVQPAALTNIIVVHDERGQFRNVIDGKLDATMGWSNGPWRGNSNTAIVATRLDRARDDDLKVELYFSRGQLAQQNLGRFRLSVCGDPAAFAREEKRFAILNVTDPALQLAAAYAMHGSIDEALRYFARALARADGYEARRPILELAAGFDDLLRALVERQPGDPQLQLALARNLAARGQQRLDAKRPAEARVDLEKSREIFARLRAEHPAPWTVLAPTELKSTGGETLTVENDGSIFVSGPIPDRAVYTLKAQSALPTVTAIRLETIPDGRLPNGGAGRAVTGCLALAEFTAALLSGKEAGEPAPIDISSAIGDRSPSEMDPPSHTIDGNLRTVWDPFPKLREPHFAVFVLKSPARIDGRSLSITLDSGSAYTQHGMGRFRLSVTNEVEIISRAPLRQDLKESEIAQLNGALAGAYHLQGDQRALEGLQKAHPEAAAAIGDLYAADKDWRRAVVEYTMAMTAGHHEATLLAKRAEAYEKLWQWDLAMADWAQASQRQTDVSFEHFKAAGAESWRFETANGADGSMELVDGTLIFTTTVATGTNWHVQVLQGELQMENGAEYLIRFKMKSPDSCTVTLWGGINEGDYHGIGLNETLAPTSEFSDFEFTFVAHDVVPRNNRIGFSFGVNRGKVMVKEVVFRKAQSAEAYAKAFTEPPDQDTRTRILDELSRFPGVLTALRRSLPEEPAIQEAYRRIAERRAGPNAAASRALLAALDQHRRGEKDEARLAYRKAVAALQPVGENAVVPALLERAVWEFGPDAPETEKQLAAAIGEPPADLTAAIKNHPNQAAGYLARCDWYARRGLWRKAADDLAAAFRLQPEVLTGLRLGILLAEIGEADRYRDHCQKLVDRVSGTSDNFEAERTLKACCLLGPDPVGDPSRLARLAQVAVSGDPSRPFFEWFDLAKALYEYRMGRFDAAVATSRANRTRIKATGGDDPAVAAVIAVEAMALHRAGDAQAARRSLTEAQKLIDEKVPVHFGGDVDGHDWLAARRLCREAEALLESKTGEPKQ